MAGIYIHIPFCRRICHYCDFYRIAPAFGEGLYADALKRELELRADYLGGESVGTIYFGGGTPSVLDARWLNRMIEEISRYYRIEDPCEITLEANPDDLSGPWLKSIREKTSINRLSIGIQSFVDRDLQLMNRRHTADEAFQSVSRARRVGFANISADLIYGIPGSSLQDLAYSMDRMAALDIQHLSAYHLTIEPGTLFYWKMEKGLIRPVDEEESLKQFRYLISRARSEGFKHYEISNWAKAGFISNHNTNYWKGIPYLGLGPSAHSYDRVSRQWNVPDLRQYLQGIEKGNPVVEKEVLTPAMRLNEYLLTSLRTMWGIDMKEVQSAFGMASCIRLEKGCEKYIRSGHMKKDGNVYTLTEEGYFISDAIIRNLML